MNTIKTLAEELAGSRETKGRRLPRQVLQLLPYAAGFDRAVSPLLTWSIIFTVMSFVRKMPSLKFLVSQSMWSKMMPHADFIDGSQGFAMLLFAAKNNSKAKMATPPGRLWTSLLRRALRTVIMSAKADLFKNAGAGAEADSVVPPNESIGPGTVSAECPERCGVGELPSEPDWLAQFRDNASIVRTVDESMRKLQGYTKDVSISSATADSVSEGPRGRTKKRQK